MHREELQATRETRPHGSRDFHLCLHEVTPSRLWSAVIPPHWHEEYELVFITAGRGLAFVGGRNFPVAAGDILVIASGVVHALFADGDEPPSFYAVVFGIELLNSCEPDTIQRRYINPLQSGALLFRDLYHPGDPCYQHLQNALQAIRTTYHAGVAGNELLIKAELLRCWHYLCVSAMQQPAPERRSPEKNELTKAMLDYIREHFAQELSLDSMAESFHLSKSQLCRFFKAQVSMTIVEYLNYIRIGTACDMLQNSNADISTVALSCGYNTISYFNRVFLRAMHCTPTQYRESGTVGQ